MRVCIASISYLNIWKRKYGTQRTGKTGIRRAGPRWRPVDLCACRARVWLVRMWTSARTRTTKTYLFNQFSSQQTTTPSSSACAHFFATTTPEKIQKKGEYSLLAFFALFPPFTGWWWGLTVSQACDVCWRWFGWKFCIFLRTVEMQNKNEERLSFLLLSLAYRSHITKICIFIRSYIKLRVYAGCWWHRWHSAENIWRWSRWRCMALIWRCWPVWLHARFCDTLEKHPAKGIYIHKSNNKKIVDWTGHKNGEKENSYLSSMCECDASITKSDLWLRNFFK